MSKSVKLHFVHYEDEESRPALGVEAIDTSSHEIQKVGSIREVDAWLKRGGFRYATGSQAVWFREAA